MDMRTSTISTDTIAIDEEAAWRAFETRDRSADGRFVVGVLTTGIYCRPSCPARHPRRENVRFYVSGVEAAGDGLRACLRCKPDEVSRDTAAIERALRLLAEADAPPTLAELADA